jgi:biofilm PGA synthesis N-glycosyltransferase PgaC
MSVSPRRSVLEAYRTDGAPTSLRNTPMVAGAVRVTILIPAHNEEASLPTTLSALKLQSRQPDRVIVVADNCTDRTVEIARDFGYEAFRSVDNIHRKGGALNQALAQLLPTTDANDVVMVMDADTALGPEYLEVGARRLAEDPELTAVGGVFYGEGGSGLVGQFQRNEYTRYSLQIRSRRGRVFVLTGTASMFRAEALLDVAAARGVFIPGETGRVYDTAALTEDNELTLALKSLGATMTSPYQCTVTTEIMPTWNNLWVQRKRWQRGALENLSAYGITRATIRYWGQQVGIGYGAVALNTFLFLMIITLVSMDRWVWFPFWIIVGSVFVIERVLTVWRGGWRARGLAIVILPELLYDVFLQIVFIKCLFDIALARRARWGHVQHKAEVST